jgi:iron complex outermembrane receptor protein
MSKKYFTIMIIFVLFFIQPGLAPGQERQPQEYLLEEVIVTAEPTPPQAEKISTETLESGRFTNVGQAVAELPGVSAVRRAASSIEPVIRGLGWERVYTQMDHLPIFGACPGHMDPPITYGRSHATEELVVIKGVPSVTLGPGGTGGRIIVKTDYERKPDVPSQLDGWVRSGYDTVRQGIFGEIGAKGGNRWLDFRGAFETLDYNDYESADRLEVPADQNEYSTSFSLGVRPHKDHRWWNSINYVREEDIDYPSLPMNLDETDYWTYNTGYRVDFAQQTLKKFDASFGLLNIDHVMSNRNKPNRAMFENETTSDSDACSASAKMVWKVDPRIELTTGADYFHLSRDAVRSRFNVNTGQRFFDHIWPETTQWDLGAFAETNVELSDVLRLRIGGRVDRVESDVDAVDEPSLQGKTIQENYVRFYGGEAEDVNRAETLGSGNVVVEWEVDDQFTMHAGGGVSHRTAGLTERYFAFAPAPGGYQIGNPALDPEKKYEVETGFDWLSSSLDFSLSLYHLWFHDYILPTAVDWQDVNGDGTGDLIRGFKNIDARLYGAESVISFRLNEHLQFPLSVSYVRGKNTSDDRDLPEIPPLEARAAVRYKNGRYIPWWVEFGGRFVAKQDKVDETFPEDATDAFNVFHLRSGFAFGKSFRMEAGVENLFNEDYNEHLTREALLPVGDLKQGDEVPAPGRSFQISFRLDF